MQLVGPLRSPLLRQSSGASTFDFQATAKGAVFSLRLMVTAYAGNCVRIRRSSDNAEQDFGFVSSVVDTAGIATFVGGGSGYVTTWYDQSGNGLGVTQGTAANQPAFIASGIGGKPTLRQPITSSETFSKTSVDFSAFTNSNEITIMAVFQQDTKTDNTLFAWNNSGTNRILFHATQSTILYFDFGNNTAGTGRISVAQPSGWTSGPHIPEAYRTVAGGQAILVDGVSLASGSGYSASPASSATTFWVGQFGSGATSSDSSIGGDLSELIILKTDIGLAARSSLRANLGSYYGITVS